MSAKSNAATKKPVSSKKNAFTNPALIDALHNTLSPLVVLINENPRSQTEDPESGHQDRASQDMGIKITLSNIIQVLHNQYNGLVPVKGGGTRQIDTLNQRVMKAEGDLQDFVKRFTDHETGEVNADAIMGQNRYWQLVNWLDQQQTRLSFVGQQLDAYLTIYRDVMREDWVPYVPVTEVMSSADLTKKSDAIIEANRARLAQMQALKQARAG